MKRNPPDTEAMAAFDRMAGLAFVWFLLAFAVWSAQDLAASLVASEFTAKARLSASNDDDDSRLLAAWDAARRTAPARARLETDPDPQHRTREAWIVVTAASKREAAKQLEALADATRTAMLSGPQSGLFAIDRKATAPVPSAGSQRASAACRWGSGALALGGLVFALARWRRSHLPLVALLGLAATVATAALSVMGTSAGALLFVGAVAVAVPVGLVVLVGTLTRRVSRAATWVEGRARITRSEVAVERHRFAGSATTVTNAASVAYEFAAGGETVRGECISLGARPADAVDRVLARYAVGAHVPVFYDPANPADCVLEREPPVPMPLLWAGTAVFVVAWAGGVAAFWTGRSPLPLLRAASSTLLPGVHYPLLAAGSALAGLLSLGSFLWNRQHVRTAFPWKRVRGRIVSSSVESSGSTGQGTTFYRALVEFEYSVDGQEYHNTVRSSGGTQARAEADAARYPAGAGADVYYDPEAPTRSALSVDTELLLTGRASLVAAVALFAVAAFAVLR